MTGAEHWVRHYLSLGFTVIPAYPRSKKPALDWKKYQTIRPTEAELEAWMRLWASGYNVAIVCGTASGGLAVLDIDAYRTSKVLGAIRLEKLIRETMVVQTPSGGYHVYFRVQGPVPSFSVTSPSGEVLLEVKGDGRYVIAPPSACYPKEPEGAGQGAQPRPYTLISEAREPAEVESHNLRRDLVETLRARGVEVSMKPDGPAYVEGAVARGRGYRGPPMPCIERLLQGVKAGFRNEAAVRMASYYLNLRKYRPGKAWAMLREWNRANSPPLPERELRSCFDSVRRRGYVYGCTSLSIVYCDRIRCPLRPILTIPEDAAGTWDEIKRDLVKAARRGRLYS